MTEEQPRFAFMPLAALLAGNASLAMGAWLVRMADTGPVSAGFWRLFLALPFLLLLARANGQSVIGFPRKTMWAVLAGGALFGFDLASWHIGIEMTRLANATLFGNAGSVGLMIWGFIAWQRLPRGKEWPALLAAFVGAGLLLGRSIEISLASFYGDLFCLLAGLLYAGYLIILQDARKGLGSWSLLSWAVIGALPPLLMVALLRGEPFWPTVWWPVIVLAMSNQLIGQGMLVYAMRHFSPLVIGIALLTQPALAALAGWISFGEVLSAVDMLGVALVGSALVLAKMAQGGAGRKAVKP